VTEIFNSYFCKISEEILKKNGNRMRNSEKEHLKIRESNKTMFLYPIRESEVEKVAKGLKNKLTVGIDEIPDYVVKQCIKLVKNLDLCLTVHHQCR
jgi:hypothetical protein